METNVDMCLCYHNCDKIVNRVVELPDGRIFCAANKGRIYIFNPKTRKREFTFKDTEIIHNVIHSNGTLICRLFSDKIKIWY